MPRKPSTTLTRAELRIMEVLWKAGRATVAEVAAALPPPAVAYNTVLTILRILERKGHVAHEEAGRAFVYRPAIARDDAAQSAVGDVVLRFFRNKPGELARLRALIDQHEEKS